MRIAITAFTAMPAATTPVRNPTIKLRRNRDNGNFCGSRKGSTAETHRGGKAIASEPTQHVLHTVCEKQKPQNQTKHGGGEALIGRLRWAKQVRALFRNIDLPRAGLLPSPRQD